VAKSCEQVNGTVGGVGGGEPMVTRMGVGWQDGASVEPPYVTTRLLKCGWRLGKGMRQRQRSGGAIAACSPPRLNMKRG